MRLPFRHPRVWLCARCQLIARCAIPKTWAHQCRVRDSWPSVRPSRPVGAVLGSGVSPPHTFEGVSATLRLTPFEGVPRPFEGLPRRHRRYRSGQRGAPSRPRRDPRWRANGEGIVFGGPSRDSAGGSRSGSGALRASQCLVDLAELERLSNPPSDGMARRRADGGSADHEQRRAGRIALQQRDGAVGIRRDR